ncbi:MAG: tetratricopeptide repeat protein [Planctomycetes bacterium]|nr:tetratricopeptide repeat protein [Planctomycetota bacterium]
MSERCQGDPPAAAGGARTDPREVRVPVHPDSGPRGSARIRASRAGRWRAAVLILVHVLIAAHFVHWWVAGETLAPFEPSEAIEFATKGVVNVGFVLFAVAILSTAVLGRWFCGWACHVVALQDLCRWLLVRLGLTPRLVDLGPLRVVPWLAFVYMFLAPLLDRALAGVPLGPAELHFTTVDLWRTFPKSWIEAVVTLVVCGFVIVWLLGSKGFCTYACPYGGIFGVADQLAPARIRVTDACEGCGHCSAVCTSNVNVAREVREHGMVVDPGCMKCLDCVSVCPNDALYVGFGRPALLAPKPAAAARAARSRPAPLDVGRLVLGAAFAYAALFVFLWHDGIVAPGFTALTWALAFAVMLAFRGRSRSQPARTLAEEALVAALFLASMACFRGFRESVSFLFALGISVLVAWWGVELGRLVWSAEARLQRTPLKRAGRVTRAGVVFAACALPIVGLGIAGAAEQVAERRDRAAHQAAAHAARQAATAEYNRGAEAGRAGRLEEAIAAFQRALELDPAFLEARETLAGTLCMAGRYEEGLAQFDLALAQRPNDADTLALSARALTALGRLPAARDRALRAVEQAPERADLWALLAELQDSTGESGPAAASRARAAALQRSAPPRAPAPR